MKITSGPHQKKTIHPNAYAAALAQTDRMARHHVVDTTPKHARQCQREFAGKINRMAKLLAREYPDVEMHFSGGCMEPSLRRIAGQQIMSVSIWMIRDTTIFRSFVVAGCGKIVRTYIETTRYPHHHCDANLGRTTVVCANDGMTVVRAVRAIIATKFQTFEVIAEVVN